MGPPTLPVSCVVAKPPHERHGGGGAEMLSDCWYGLQQKLFPRLERELSPMGERCDFFVTVLELVRVKAHLSCFLGQVRWGRLCSAANVEVPRGRLVASALGM